MLPLMESRAVMEGAGSAIFQSAPIACITSFNPVNMPL